MKDQKRKEIPKIIHYCWFGNNNIPDDHLEYINSWDILNDYEIHKWTEENFEFSDCEFNKKAITEEKWVYMGDYCKLKVLYEYGGIYLDTDVRVFKKFDSLLVNQCFLNFIYDCSVGAGIIGATPQNPFIKELLDIYENILFSDEVEKDFILEKNGSYILKDFVTTNHIYTHYILNKYESFQLDNSYQDMDDFVIYPKELFELGSFLKKHFTIHYAAGAWRVNKDDGNSGFNMVLKRFLSRWPNIYEYAQMAIRKIRYVKQNKNMIFYEESIRRKKYK